MQRIGRRDFRIIFKIELLCLLIFSVNEESPPSDDLGTCHSSSKGVEKKVFPETLPLLRMVEG